MEYTFRKSAMAIDDDERRTGTGMPAGLASKGMNLPATPASPLYFNRERLFERQQKVIANWKPASEIWALKYGSDLHGVSAMASSIYLTYFFRRLAKLRTLAQYTTYLPTAALCSVTANVMHNFGVMPTILLREDTCPICLQIRAACLQTLPSVVQPLMLSYLVTALSARKYMTTSMPAILPFQPWYRFMKANTKGLYKAVNLLLLCNIAVAVIVTMNESKQTLKVWDEMVVYKDKET